MAVPNPNSPYAKKTPFESAAPLKMPGSSPTTTTTTAAAAPKTVPNPNQAAAQAWINNPASGQGGLEAYTKRQNERYQAASQSNDADLLNRLRSDSERVGYTLNPYNPPTSTVKSTQAPTQFTDWQAKQAELMNRYEQLLSGSFQYDPEDDPRYQSYRELANSRAAAAAQDANRNTLETMNDRGILNSTVTSSQLSQNENRFRQQAETEALAQLPAFYSEARADYQDRLRNAGDLLRFAADQGRTASDMAYRDSRAARGDMESDRAYDRGVAESDRAFERQVGRDAVADSQWQQTMEYQRLSDQEKMEYQRTRDAIEDERYKQKFDEDVRRYGLDRALQEAQLAISRQNANTSAASAANSAGNAAFGRLMDIWQATGVAPEGIPGVAPGTPLAGKQPTPKSTDYKSNPDFASDVAYLKSNPNEAKKLDTSPDAFINEYGYDGYLALRKAAGLDKDN